MKRDLWAVDEAGSHLKPSRVEGSAPVLVLGPDDRAILESWAHRRNTGQALAQRARAVLGCATGKTNGTIARELRISRATVGRWRRRFLSSGVEGLQDEPRPGAPPRITDADVARVIELTLGSTPHDAPRWSTRSMAARSGLTQSAVSRIWRAFALEPSHQELLKLSGEPHYINKVRDIAGLYVHPPDRVVALSVDPRAQSSDGRPLVLTKSAGLERRTRDYLRRQTTPPFAAVDAATAADGGRRQPRHRAIEFRQFLDDVDRIVPSDLEVHLILDSRATSRTWLIQRWLARRPRYHLHSAPIGVSWSTLAECWLVLLSAKPFHSDAFHGIRSVIEAMRQYVETREGTFTPFIWTNLRPTPGAPSDCLLQKF